MEYESVEEAKRYKSYNDELTLIYKEYFEKLQLAGLTELSMEYTRNIKRQKVISLMDPLDESIVLDVGCGQGRLLSEISGRIKLGIGLDISRNIFLKTAQRFELAQADACFLPFTDGCFDRVVAMELIEHLLPEHVDRMLKEIHRVLKKDGRLIITTPRRRGIFSFLMAPFFSVINFIYCLFNRRAKRYWTSLITSCKAISRKYGISEHNKEYERKELFNLLGQAGFIVHAWNVSTISPYLSPTHSIFLKANEFDPRFFKFWKKLSDFLTKHAPGKSAWDIIILCGKAREEREI